jgi:sulfhydrogenase subunit beta (sulfur reductase)
MMSDSTFLSRQGLEQLLTGLVADHRLIGPRIEQGAVQYRPLQDAAQLPWGVRVEQQPGSYRLQQQGSSRAFAWANGPQALKPLLFAPQESLWRVVRTKEGLSFSETLPAPERLAVIGVRSCDLAALALQDNHFLQGAEPDPHYARRRASLFIVAVNCSHPAATCFCAASGDGPSANSGFDLLLDELDEGFLLTSGSEAGHRLLAALPLSGATPAQRQQVEAQRRAAAEQQRVLPSHSLSGRLLALASSPHWQQIAERCLSCGNCTAVCPTCFCHSEHDAPQLDGEGSEHLRQWDSCFSAGHSLLHGTPVRAATAHRYRQWLSHKFDSWHQQFGRSGCVGCGRCITWCPVGIDVTEELHALCGDEA